MTHDVRFATTAALSPLPAPGASLGANRTGGDLTDTAAALALATATLSDPFAVLGPHDTADGRVIRTFQPGAEAVRVLHPETATPLGNLERELTDGLFTGLVTGPLHYLLEITWPGGIQVTEDPYSFGLLLSDDELNLFREGKLRNLANQFGAASVSVSGVPGVRFALWAPNAQRVAVIGDFNSWDGRRNPMRHRVEAGVWELFIPRVTAGANYKFEISSRRGEHKVYKADPVARQSERPPATASVVPSSEGFEWSDHLWLERRGERQLDRAAISIYEVHAGSWLSQPEDSGRSMWAQLAERLVPYVRQLGFTHLQLLPIMEHPFGGSWGYQPTSQFAPSARWGTPTEFARFVDACHQQDLGVILDWVPAHFPNDPHGLAEFDGTHLYEHEDPRQGIHRDWNTHIFNLGRTEVQEFLLASALFWLRQYHIDGLRVDAVASMLYRDYSRSGGEWVPNIYGGNENLEAIAFLRNLNELVLQQCPGALVIAEESTAWPKVTAPPSSGGLGFTFKWNMGWMHDTLAYMGKDPIYRRWHHNQMTFGLIYAFSERFVLPLSHDEVVYGKGSLYQRAPGDEWHKLATLRAYFTFMWTQPGKKLMFMGGEIGQRREWNHDAQIDWFLLDDPGHAGLQRLVADLNLLYCSEAPLHQGDAHQWGFQWVISDDAANSVFAYLRKDQLGRSMLAVINMTPVVHEGYRIGVPRDGFWRERLNSDSHTYGGSNVGNYGQVIAEPIGAHGFAFSLSLRLPPLAGLVLQPLDA